jgi:hypothetical protein
MTVKRITLAALTFAAAVLVGPTPAQATQLWCDDYGSSVFLNITRVDAVTVQIVTKAQPTSTAHLYGEDNGQSPTDPLATVHQPANTSIHFNIHAGLPHHYWISNTTPEWPHGVCHSPIVYHA